MKITPMFYRACAARDTGGSVGKVQNLEFSSFLSLQRPQAEFFLDSFEQERVINFYFESRRLCRFGRTTNTPGSLIGRVLKQNSPLTYLLTCTCRGIHPGGLIRHHQGRNTVMFRE